MGKLKDVLGEDGYQELEALLSKTEPVNNQPEWQKVIVGILKSKLVWLGTAIAALPQLWPMVAPQLEDLMTPNMYKRLMLIGGILVVVFRFYTQQSIKDKGTK